MASLNISFNFKNSPETSSTSTTVTPITTITKEAYDEDELIEDSDDFIEDEPYLKSESSESEETSAITSRKDKISFDLSPFSRYNDYDKGELIELFEDEDSGNKFLKVLKERNMSLEDFLDQRRRGSSDVHLAMLVENKTTEKLPAGNFNDELDIVTAFENFPHFNLVDLKSMRPNEMNKGSQENTYIDDQAGENVSKEESGNITETHQQSRPGNQNVFFPSWKTLALASLTSQENIDKVYQRSKSKPKQTNQGQDLVDLELSGHGLKKSPPKTDDENFLSLELQSILITSSIIVSAILGFVIVISVGIRWRQRRRKQLDFTETYNAMKSKLPPLTISQPTSSLNRGRFDDLSPHSSSHRFTSSSGSSTLKHQHPQHTLRLSIQNEPYSYSLNRTGRMANISKVGINPKDDLQEFSFDSLLDSY
ncbi:hypothetical protein ACFFRR_002458 [Megaselia abdita]